MILLFPAGSRALTSGHALFVAQFSRLTLFSLCLMASMVRDGAISPLELVEAHLRQIDGAIRRLNAFVAVLADEALATARG